MKSSIHSLLISLSFVSIHFLHCSHGGGSAVKYLPGFPGQLPFELETGYVGTDEGENVQLFYYFVKSSSENPENDPLILWLTGGPGCSAITELVFGIGPLKFEEYYGGGDLPNLTVNPYSWTEVANMMFVDLPVGIGFSYAKTPEASRSTGLQSCRQAYQFLQKWLVDHPDFVSNPFYVGGDSYTGITIPVIVQLISDGNEAGIEPRINLKGYLLGNPLTFQDEENYRIPYAHGMGLISDELYQSLRRNCRGEYWNVDSNNLLCSQDVETFHQLVDEVSQSHILEAKCKNLYFERRFIKELHDSELLLPPMKCHNKIYRPALYWVNDPGVQEALHIEEGSITKWVRCNFSLSLYTEKYWESTPYHAYLSTKGYRSLIYSGDHDMIVPHISTQAWIRSLKYPVVGEWRQWVFEDQIAGYTRTYANNMTFATVKGAGHVAPMYFPERCAAMVKRWLSYQSL